MKAEDKIIEDFFSRAFNSPTLMKKTEECRSVSEFCELCTSNGFMISSRQIRDWASTGLHGFIINSKKRIQLCRPGWGLKPEMRA